MKPSAVPFPAALLLAASCLAGPAAASPANDYPTEARVDYVIGCMMTNGQSHESMRKCSCSIDKIADAVTYKDYVSIETLQTLAEVPGERAAAMRINNWAKDLLDKFRQAQVTADRECF